MLLSMFAAYRNSALSMCWGCLFMCLIDHRENYPVVLIFNKLGLTITNEITVVISIIFVDVMNVLFFQVFHLRKYQ